MRATTAFKKSIGGVVWRPPSEVISTMRKRSSQIATVAEAAQEYRTACSLDPLFNTYSYL